VKASTLVLDRKYHILVLVAINNVFTMKKYTNFYNLFIFSSISNTNKFTIESLESKVLVFCTAVQNRVFKKGLG